MEFQLGDSKIILTGDVVEDNRGMSFSQLQASGHSAEVDQILEIIIWPSPSEKKAQSLLSLESNSFTSPANISPEVQHLLLEYQHLFSLPTGLPPRRSIDHRIHLLPNAALMNVFPYRYRQF